MLTAEGNELLTRIGPGTRMGNLLRRYWQPVAAEMENRLTLKVQIVGGNLVLFKTREGALGLVAEACPHRAAREPGKDMYSDGFVSHIRRQMSHFSPIAEELIDMFTKDRGSRESARAAE